MGCSISILPVLRNQSEKIQIIPDIYCYKYTNNNDEIDMDALLLVLMKLSRIFVNRKHLDDSFFETVYSSAYSDFDSQFIAVALWICEQDRHARATPYEIFTLIKYAELYHPLNDEPHDNQSCSLICPRGKEIPAFRTQVRALEAKRFSEGYQTRFTPVDNTVKLQQFRSGELSCVDLEEYYDI